MKLKLRPVTVAAVSFGCSLAVFTYAMTAANEESTTPTTDTINIGNQPDWIGAAADAQAQADAELNRFLTTITTTTTTRPQPRTSAATGDVWDQLAACECGGNWGCNTGNGYYGGLQFAATSWIGFGGQEFAPMAHQATREQQIVIGQRILDRMGWGAWPGCTRKIGLR